MSPRTQMQQARAGQETRTRQRRREPLRGDQVGAHGFALALIIGVIIGTYSSIYVASTAIIMMGVSKADLMPVKKEGLEADERS